MSLTHIKDHIQPPSVVWGVTRPQAELLSFRNSKKRNIEYISAFYQLMLESFPLMLFLLNDGMGWVY